MSFLHNLQEVDIEMTSQSRHEAGKQWRHASVRKISLINHFQLCRFLLTSEYVLKKTRRKQKHFAAENAKDRNKSIGPHQVFTGSYKKNVK